MNTETEEEVSEREITATEELMELMDSIFDKYSPPEMSGAFQDLFLHHLKCYILPLVDKEQAKELMRALHLSNCKYLNKVYSDERFIEHQKDIRELVKGK